LKRTKSRQSTSAFRPPTAPNVSNLQNLNPLSFNTESANFKSGVIDQYNLQVEQQFGPNVFTIGYVGNVGHHLPQVINDINPAPYSTNANSPLYQPGTAIRPNSGPRKLDPQFPGGNLSGVGLVQSEGISNYNGLQVALQRLFSKGLAFDANYTWSKGLSDNTGYSQEGSQDGFRMPTQPGCSKLSMVLRRIISRAALRFPRTTSFNMARPGQG
jgi:hypothetical protein